MNILLWIIVMAAIAVGGYFMRDIIRSQAHNDMRLDEHWGQLRFLDRRDVTNLMFIQGGQARLMDHITRSATQLLQVAKGSQHNQAHIEDILTLIQQLVRNQNILQDVVSKNMDQITRQDIIIRQAFQREYGDDSLLPVLPLA